MAGELESSGESNADWRTNVKRMTLSIVLLIAAVGCNGRGITEPESSLAKVRAQFEPMKDLANANSAGYTVWSPNPTVTGSTCPSSSEGNMGYHLVNVSLRGAASNPAAGDAVIDMMQPEMLMYEKGSGGALTLAGVEYIVFKDAWERVNGAGAEPPKVFGQPLLASSHTFVSGGPSIPHYELHVWLYKDNPRGMFYPYNPNVTC